MRLWRKIRKPVAKRILHLDDTPHRIALGVFLGFVVGLTPTMGAQIILYWILAHLIRANRASGLLPVLLTNPLTALPIYLFNWKVGHWLLHGIGSSLEPAAVQSARLQRFIETFNVTHIFEAAYWRMLAPGLKGLGAELVAGCLAVGLVCGSIGYVLTYYGVLAHRRKRVRRVPSPA